MPTTVDNYIIKGVQAVTPSDTTEHDNYNDGILVKNAGDVCFVCDDDTTDTWAFGSYDMVALKFKKIMATGTDATGIVGLKLYQ